jgi:hypothetical protein
MTRPDMAQLPEPGRPRRPWLAPWPVAAVAFAVAVVLAVILWGRLAP